MNTQESLLELMDTGRPLEIKRATAVRMVMQGYSRSQIADLLGISMQFIDKWKSVFDESRRDFVTFTEHPCSFELLNSPRDGVLHIPDTSGVRRPFATMLATGRLPP